MKNKDLDKSAQTSSTQPTYVDSAGNVFTAARIVTEGFKPVGKYKGHSISETVTNPEFGKVKGKK